MAVVESLKKSTINIESISKSLSSTQKTVLSTSNSVDNISKIIVNNTRIKRELFVRSEILDSRRKEASKRQEIEDQIESSRVSSQPSRGLSFVGKSDKSPLGRILGFLGFTFAGWIAENLPTWIFMGKEFISRIQSFGRSMYDMVDNMKLIIESFGSVLKNSFDSIVRLDFNEFSEGSVTQSFDELINTIQGLGSEITETFKLFTTPLTESVETGEQAPGLAEDRPETMFPTSTSEVSGGVGTKEQQALLKAIRFAEGTTSSYGVISGGDIVPELAEGKLTVQETINLAQTSKLPARFGGRRVNHVYSGATGAYQFMPNTLRGIVSAGVLKPNELFTPQKQDEAALYLASRRKVTAEVLQKEGLSQRVSDLLAPEWASFPYSPKGGKSYYGQSYKPYGSLKSVYESSLSSSGQVTPSKSIADQSKLPPLPRTGTLPGGVQAYGAQRRGGRRHAGVDFDAPDNGTFYSRLGGEVTYIGNDPGGYYRYVDIYNSQLGVTERIAEGDTILVKLNQKVSPGTLVARGTKSTGVFHYEIRKGKSQTYGFEGTLDPIKFLQSVKPTQDVSAPRSDKPQISPQPRPQQYEAMTPERKGSQILVIDDSQPQAPQVSYPSPQQQSSVPTISEFRLLNNFIKNKLLLDLAYL